MLSRAKTEKRSLTDAAQPSIEFEPRRTVEGKTSSRHPLASVRGQFTCLSVSVVEKPAACQVVGFRAQFTAYRSRCVTHFDCLEIFRNHSNVFVQHVRVTTLYHKTLAVCSR